LPRGIGYHPAAPPRPAWQDRLMAALKEPTEIINVAEPVVACDGGGGALGHPRVYLNITTGGLIDCPYCGRRYVLQADGARTAHH
jgi:uncharacterized Zn-finger protein